MMGIETGAFIGQCYTERTQSRMEALLSAYRRQNEDLSNVISGLRSTLARLRGDIPEPVSTSNTGNIAPIPSGLINCLEVASAAIDRSLGEIESLERELSGLI